MKKTVYIFYYLLLKLSLSIVYFQIIKNLNLYKSIPRLKGKQL